MLMAVLVSARVRIHPPPLHSPALFLLTDLCREPAYVEQNPAAFKNAFFDIAWVKVYA